jgi:hypothetical protein
MRLISPATPARTPPQHLMRYGLAPGMTVPYRSALTIFRHCDGGPQLQSRGTEELCAQVLLKVLERDEEGRCSVLSHFQPERRLVDGQDHPLPEARVVYLKHDNRGRLLECSDSAGSAAMLLLPEEPVGTGSEWKVVQWHQPPGRSRPLEVVTLYRLERVAGARIHVGFFADEVGYQGELPDSEGTAYALSARGRFEFDWEDGLVVAAETESRMAMRRDRVSAEVLTTQSLTLAL